MVLPFHAVLRYVSQKHGGDVDLTRRAYWDLFPELDVDSLPIPTPTVNIKFPAWIRRQKMRDLHKDIGFLGLTPETKTAIEILTMKRFPQEEILALGPNDLVSSYQRYYCSFGYDVDIDEYFTLFHFPDAVHLRRVCLESNDRNFICSLLGLPAKEGSLRDQAERLAGMFLAQSHLCLIQGRVKKATMLAQATQRTVSIFDKVEPPQSSDDLMTLLARDKDFDEPTLYTMEDLNRMAANYDE